ncbi:hypothetical protein CBM2589_A90876 [Cupriavidus taiwanensis]|uniref:Uncharacterized protein n=1 Tax=Cupriavidus taiwanensis TaxID=164546 RepID=A0A375CGN0_9BURK|nr:hypothetical protein CBM2589_A90876 [Cupriavidus taiwanensis]
MRLPSWLDRDRSPLRGRLPGREVRLSSGKTWRAGPCARRPPKQFNTRLGSVQIGPGAPPGLGGSGGRAGIYWGLVRPGAARAIRKCLKCPP